MPVDPSALDAFFNPRRIAIIGASEQGMYPAGILQNLMTHGFCGEIYPVNPRRSTVFGLPAYADVTQTPHSPDLAVFTLPREGVIPALRQCAQVGVRAACLISAGFAEAGADGKRVQAEMVELARGSQMAVIGPNCAGLANIPARMVATRLPVPPRPGNISFTSQSGALMMALYGLFADRRAGICVQLNTAARPAGTPLAAADAIHRGLEPDRELVAVDALADGFGGDLGHRRRAVFRLFAPAGGRPGDGPAHQAGRAAAGGSSAAKRLTPAPVAHPDSRP